MYLIVNEVKFFVENVIVNLICVYFNYWFVCVVRLKVDYLQ